MANTNSFNENVKTNETNVTNLTNETNKSHGCAYGMGEVNMESLRVDWSNTKETTVGLKELRSNVSEFFQRAINNFEEVLIGNVKTGGKTVSMISTELLNEILKSYQFKPVVAFDDSTKQHEIMLKEIGAYGSGETIEEALSITLENILALTEDYFEELDLNIRIEKTKAQYPYFLRIEHCKTTDELIKVLNLDK